MIGEFLDISTFLRLQRIADFNNYCTLRYINVKPLQKSGTYQLSSSVLTVRNIKYDNKLMTEGEWWKACM